MNLNTSRFNCCVLSQTANIEPMHIMLVAVSIVTILVILFVFFIAARLFRLWLQAFLASADISMFHLIGMLLRRTPADQVVRWKIMAAQAEVPVTATQIESALLQGADVERAVLALIRAKRTGVSLAWQDVIAEDADQRLRQKLYGDSIHNEPFDT